MWIMAVVDRSVVCCTVLWQGGLHVDHGCGGQVCGVLYCTVVRRSASGPWLWWIGLWSGVKLCGGLTVDNGFCG